MFPSTRERGEYGIRGKKLRGRCRFQVRATSSLLRYNGGDGNRWTASGRPNGVVRINRKSREWKRSSFSRSRGTMVEL